MPGTIVYVDNEPDLPSGLERELGRLGFRLETLRDTDEAFARISGGSVRLVLVEVLVDEGRGFELIRRIRRLAPPRGDTPVVVLTRGERSPKLYGRAVELGADDFLARPVRRAELLDAILECAEARPPVDVTAPASGGGAGGEEAGSLEAMPVPELLLALRQQGATGLLFVQDFEAVAVQLRHGSPIAVASSRGDESFADFLIRTKRISGDEHDELLERAHAHGETEAEAALAIGALTPEEARAAQTDRSGEPLLEAFGWSTGSWRFEPGRRLRSGQALEHGAVGLLVRGVLQWASARSVRAMLDRRGDLYLSRVERPPVPLESLDPPPCDPPLIAGWVGDRTIAEVLASGAVGERELYALLVAGLVEGRAEPLLELEQVIAPPKPRVVPAAPARPAPAGRQRERAPGPAPVTPVEPAPPVPAPAEGAAASASIPAAEPKAPVAEASPAERSREAERHFFEGEGHLAARRYEQAAASFGLASHLVPDEGEYRAHLGYALHLQHPASPVVRREALEHIAKGIKLSPERWKPPLYLARVFIAAGDEQNARTVLRGAVRRHPECQALASELRGLRKRAASAEPSGLLARLRRWWRR